MNKLAQRLVFRGNIHKRSVVSDAQVGEGNITAAALVRASQNGLSVHASLYP